MNDRLTTLLIGTSNPGKIAEIRLAFADLPLALKSLSDFSNLPSVAETGRTYKENAVLKAMGYAENTGLLTLADDSGLEVDALDGRPGLLSARYGGEHATDEYRVRLLLSHLRNETNREAKFVCVMALANPDLVKLFEGECRGTLAMEPSGTNGFGYDPIFIPHGYDKTFGELPSSIKDSVSHRGKALSQVKKYLSKTCGV
jgi:XTP/dITP diphosphohydrolase